MAINCPDFGQVTGPHCTGCDYYLRCMVERHRLRYDREWSCPHCGKVVELLAVCPECGEMRPQT